jgi:hypothetical protein
VVGLCPLVGSGIRTLTFFLRKQACRGWLFETAGSEEVLGKVQAAFRQTLVVGIRFAVAVAFAVTNARAARGFCASVPDASGLR